MALNYIWIVLFAIGILVGGVKLIFMGDCDALPAMMDSTFKMSANAFEQAIGLTGTLTLWMGIRKYRYSVACGLMADVAGLSAAVLISYFFFYA